MILDMFMPALDRIKCFFSFGQNTLQPKDILNVLFQELDLKKKNLMDDNVFVPDHYSIVLSRIDFDDISPFISNLKDQLKTKLTERIKNKKYRLLAPLVIEIKADLGIEMNFIEIISEFNEPPTAAKVPDKPNPISKVVEPQPTAIINTPTERKKTATPVEIDGRTRICEENVTKYIDTTELTLEFVAGDSIGEIIPLKSGVYTVGRGRKAKIQIQDEEETISREHFEIAIQNGTAVIRDLGSRNGTQVNNITLSGESELKKGDAISAGKVMLKVT